MGQIGRDAGRNSGGWYTSVSVVRNARRCGLPDAAKGVESWTGVTCKAERDPGRGTDVVCRASAASSGGTQRGSSTSAARPDSRLMAIARGPAPGTSNRVPAFLPSQPSCEVSTNPRPASIAYVVITQLSKKISNSQKGIDPLRSARTIKNRTPSTRSHFHVLLTHTSKAVSQRLRSSYPEMIESTIPSPADTLALLKENLEELGCLSERRVSATLGHHLWRKRDEPGKSSGLESRFHKVPSRGADWLLISLDCH
ncbi:hypothetical protein VUR80DRAFT_9302 [Thermomyces stellatus]